MQKKKVITVIKHFYYFFSKWRGSNGANQQILHVSSRIWTLVGEISYNKQTKQMTSFFGKDQKMIKASNELYFFRIPTRSQALWSSCTLLCLDHTINRVWHQIQHRISNPRNWKYYLISLLNEYVLRLNRLKYISSMAFSVHLMRFRFRSVSCKSVRENDKRPVTNGHTYLESLAQSWAWLFRKLLYLSHLNNSKSLFFLSLVVKKREKGGKKTCPRYIISPVE